jgi:hypothetical protein
MREDWRGLAVIAIAALGLVYSSGGCSAVESIEPTSETSLCEHALSTTSLKGAECALVYECAKPSPIHPGFTELCIRERDLEAAQRANGICFESTDERFKKFDPTGFGYYDPFCFWHCGPGEGCNALDACFGCGGAS